VRACASVSICTKRRLAWAGGKPSLLAVCCFLIAVTPVSADNPAAKPVTVPFDLLVTKHMVVQIKINGKGPYRVIFDTGAPVSLINSKTALAAAVLSKDAPKPAFSLFGPAAQTTLKTVEIAGLVAHSVPVIVMDHPTVEAISQALGPVEGILGFPFFARYRMSLDYQAKQLTLAPSGFEPTDILQTLVDTLLTRDKPPARLLVPSALWGFSVEKGNKDERPGVAIKEVLPGSAAADAGLRAGDRLLSMDGRWTDSVADCYVAASYIKPGMEIAIVLERSGMELEVMVKPVPGL
jgi:membrane-associated protease RseP (regulator of RpoE activity)